MNVKKINKAIKHLGLEIVRGHGYQYFISLVNEEQIGDSVMVCHLNHLTLDEWIERAEMAVEEHVYGSPAQRLERAVCVLKNIFG